MPAINGSAGWVPGSWSRRSNSAGSKDTNKFPTFSENWKPSFHLGRRLSNGERRRKVGYARAATFNGKSGDPHHAGGRVSHQLTHLLDLIVRQSRWLGEKRIESVLVFTHASD